MRRNDHLLALLLLSATHVLSACATGYPALTYIAEPTEARVIDADTKQPLEGVAIVAHWELERGTVGGNVPAGQLMVMETTTDEDGKFAFPGWGPKTVSDSFLVDKDPRLLLFKSGYHYQALRNEYDGSIELRIRRVRRSQWNGKIIELRKFTGTQREWFEMLERSIPPLDEREDAKQISTLLKAILAEEDSVPDSIERKRPFFNNVVRRLLEGR